MLFNIKTVGFSEVGDVEKDLEQKCQVIKDVVHHSTDKASISMSGQDNFIETKKQYGKDIGVIVRGYQKGNKISFKEFVPYAEGKKMPITKLSVEKGDFKIVNKKEVIEDEYHVNCINKKTGRPMKFYLQNVVEYLQNEKEKNDYFDGVYVSALAYNGKVIIPIANEDEISEIYEVADLENKGLDESLLEGMEGIDILKSMGNWLEVVPTAFWPTQDAIATYFVLGKIKTVKSIVNKETGEKIYRLGIFTDGMTLDVYINKTDLVGEPMEGRRFMGPCWLQGKIAFK